MEYIVVKNFEKYQHYSKRPLIWIKLYRDLLNDFKFMQMTPEIRWVLLGLWLLASETGNLTELDREAVAWRLNVTDILLSHSLKLLEDSGFIRIDSIEQDECYPDASIEKSREEKKREEESREETAYGPSDLLSDFKSRKQQP